MRTVRNKTTKPLKVHLPQGKVLHLGPRQEGNIADHHVEARGVQHLVEAGELEVLGDEDAGAAPSRGHGNVHADTHGHHPATGVKKRGDR